MIEKKIDELIAALNANTEAVLGSRIEITGDTSVTPIKSAAEKKPKAKKAASKTEKPAEEPEAETVDEGPSLETVRDALIRLSDAKGRDAAKEILDAYSAKKIGDLPVDKYPVVVHAAEQRIAA